jgi:hypothetical protein
VNATHGLGIALGEVIVNGDDVNAFTGKSIEIGREGRDQGLTLTGLHLRDIAEVKRRAAHELDMEVALTKGAARCFANGGEGLGQEVVKRFAVGIALVVFIGQSAQFTVGQRLEVGLDVLDGIGERLEFAQDASFACAEHLLQNHVVSLPVSTVAFFGTPTVRSIGAPTLMTMVGGDGL